jgi:hypothetical protein
MSFNKWKSTNVYGIFNNKDLTDASMNIITPCEATFDGSLTANLINSTTSINAVDGIYSGDVTCIDMSSNTIHSTTINGTTLNVTTLNATDINFTGAVSSDDTITGNVITSTTTVNCATLNTDVINCSDLLDINRIDALELNTDVLNVNETIGCDVLTVVTSISTTTLNVSDDGNFTNDLNCRDLNCRRNIGVIKLGADEINVDEININGRMSAGHVRLYTTKTTIASSFSGNIICTMPFQGDAYKKVIIRLSSSIGTTSYTFPVAFISVPINISGNSGLVTALSTTSITITTSTSISEFVIIEGF